MLSYAGSHHPQLRDYSYLAAVKGKSSDRRFVYSVKRFKENLRTGDRFIL